MQTEDAKAKVATAANHMADMKADMTVVSNGLAKLRASPSATHSMDDLQILDDMTKAVLSMQGSIDVAIGHMSQVVNDPADPIDDVKTALDAQTDAAKEA